MKGMFGLLVCLSLISGAVFSSEKTDADWNALIAAKKLPAQDQAYCYTDELGRINGMNIDIKVRLASVSKLVTSLWALETLGINFQYKTKLTIKDNNLHISGSYDPFMGNEKIFFLLSQLNDLGYTKFQTVTFDKNFIVFPGAEGHVEDYPTITPATITKNLQSYFNTQSWTTGQKSEYTRIANINKPSRMRPVVTFEIKDVKYVEKNPYENDPAARTLTLSSPPLSKYLKEMNVESNNYVAQTLFLQLGGEKEFTDYMLDRFGLTTDTIHFWTGSGLPTTTNQVRYDNFATCSSMLSLIQSLKETSEDQGKTIEDIMAVPGSDAGTFSNRIFPADYKNAFVAKTGTLMHTSALAGAMSTKNGFNFYGIFNQSTDIEGSKAVQNEMVRSIMTAMGGPLAFNYVVTPFDTYGQDNVKQFMHDLFNRSEFMPVEEGLY
jgi:D-alanyl-D-alanine carboxypeptidase/D-alanyl-D-alanine-endopeptidase (penicillin-binding protein 4)